MDIKKYRVVCSQPQMSDEIYVDIAPDNGVIHDQIFFSRMQLHRQEGGQPLQKVCGSIYLRDGNGEIQIDFPTIDAEVGSAVYEEQQQKYAALEPLIVERYRNMRDFGMESTLFICSLEQMIEKQSAHPSQKSDDLSGGSETADGSEFICKHINQIHPQTPQEEQILRQKERFVSERARRIIGERKRASEIMPAWHRFQKEYSGD